MNPAKAAVYTFFLGLGVVAACATAVDPDFESGEDGDGGEGGFLVNGPMGNGGADNAAPAQGPAGTGGDTATATTMQSGPAANTINASSSTLAGSMSSIGSIGSISSGGLTCTSSSECTTAGECCWENLNFCADDLMGLGPCLP